MGYFGALHTPGGYVVADVASALQKSIRRGDEVGALVWATELDLAGFTDYTWNRLRIISSEDVGIGDPDAVLTVRALYALWTQRIVVEKAARKAGEELPPVARVFFVHAVVALARARKCRMVDHIYMSFYEAERKDAAEFAGVEMVDETVGVDEVAVRLYDALVEQDEKVALFWATELDLRQATDVTWTTLKRYASLAVGVADPQVTLLVRTLFANWEQRIKKEQAALRGKDPRAIPPESRLYVLHAVQVLARADQDGDVYDRVELMYGEGRASVLPEDVPDYALDGHTYRGKKMGRGPEFFATVSTLLENMADLDNPYEEFGTAANLANPTMGKPHAKAAETAEQQELVTS